MSTETGPGIELIGNGSAPNAERRSRMLTSLLEISTYMVSVLDPEMLLRDLAKRIVVAMPAVSAGALWLYDKRLGRLRVVSSYGLAAISPNFEQITQLQLRAGEGLAGTVMQRDKPLLVEGSARFHEVTGQVSARNALYVQQVFEHIPREIIAVSLPLRLGSEHIGVLELYNAGLQPLPTDDDIQLLQTFAALAGGAIRNAQLYTQMQFHQRRLAAFDSVVTVINNAADLDDLLPGVLGVVLEVQGTPAGLVWVLDPSEQSLTLGAAANLPADFVVRQQQLPVIGAPCEEVVRYGQPVLRPLLDEQHHDELIERGLIHSLYLPLLAGGTVVGVMATYGGPQLRDRADFPSLMALGNQIGFAIANVRLFEEGVLERRKLAALIDSITEGVLLCDRQGRLQLANEAAMHLLSLDSIPYQQPLSEMPEFYGFRDLDGKPLPVELLPLARALGGAVFHDYRLLLRGASGDNTYVSFSGGPVHGEEGAVEGAVVVMRNVTDSQRLDQAKDEFLAVAAHELRSPLAAVRGYTDLLLRREQKRSEHDSESPELRGLTILGQQVTHMLRLVDNLLDVSRIDAGRLELQKQQVNLVALVEQAIDTVRPSAPQHEVVIDAATPELWVECDPLRIRQVVVNLLGNAIKYSSPGSQVRVLLTDSRSASVGSLHAHVSREEPYVLVAVRDQGPGIPEQQVGQLFNRYFRVGGRRVDGLGLGLYLSREFISLHGGEIWVETEIGAGSTFCFTLPLEHPARVEPAD
jgi:two-component system, OmpR family, phosphate regulon sensor histidine kinase PhoR